MSQIASQISRNAEKIFEWGIYFKYFSIINITWVPLFILLHCSVTNKPLSRTQKSCLTSNWWCHFNFLTVKQSVRQHYTFLLLWHICVPGSTQRSLFQKNGAALTAALRFDAISCDSSPADGLVKCQLAAIHLHIVLSYTGSGSNRSFYLWWLCGWWLSLSPRCPSGVCKCVAIRTNFVRMYRRHETLKYHNKHPLLFQFTYSEK